MAHVEIGGKACKPSWRSSFFEQNLPRLIFSWQRCRRPGIYVWRVTLAALIARGPDGNPNIILTDYMLGEGFIYKSRGGSWSGAWVPAIPGKPGPERAGKPEIIKALIYTSRARNAEEVYKYCEQPKLRGLLVNQIESLQPDERTLLERSYHGTDFSKCLIIHEGREPAGTGKVLLMVGGGVLLVLAALAWFVAGFIKRSEPVA